MDLNIDSITGIPSVYNNVNTARKPMALVMLSVIIIIFYVTFAFRSWYWSIPDIRVKAEAPLLLSRIMVYVYFITMLNGVHCF